MADNENWMAKMQRENELLDKYESGKAVVQQDAEGNLILVEADENATPANTQPQTEPAPTVTDGDGVNPNPTGDESVLSALMDQAQTTTPNPQEVPPSTPSTNQNEETAALKAQLAELQAELQRQRSENGRARALSDELKAKTEENQRLKEQLSAQNGMKPHEGPIDEFSDSERELMSDETLTAIGGRFAALKHLCEKQAEELAQIKAQMGKASTFIRSGEQAAMAQHINARFPDLRTIIQGDAWRQYCGEIDPITGQMNGLLFKDAIESNNPAKAEAIISRFIGASGINVGRMSGGPRPTETFSTTGQFEQPNGNKPVFRAKEVNDFLMQWYARKIPTTEQNQARYKAYSDAIDEGRVVE